MTCDQLPLSSNQRLGLSVLIVGHLLAVILPPLSFQTRQSPSVSTAIRPIEGYSQFLYIDRGYAFFAPDPGPSHLVQAAITDGAGEIVEERFPDRKKQWPRLLYHRYFMLTEFLDSMYQPPGPPAELVELDRQEAEFWFRARSQYEHLRQSYVDHLKHENPGKEVAIIRIEHVVPNILDYQREPIALDDLRLYQVIPDQLFFGDAEDLAAPTGPPETIPPPQGAVIQGAEITPEDSSTPEPKQSEPSDPNSTEDKPSPKPAADPSPDLETEATEEQKSENSETTEAEAV